MHGKNCRLGLMYVYIVWLSGLLIIISALMHGHPRGPLINYVTLKGGGGGGGEGRGYQPV